MAKIAFKPTTKDWPLALGTAPGQPRSRWLALVEDGCVSWRLGMGHIRAERQKYLSEDRHWGRSQIRGKNCGKKGKGDRWSYLGTIVVVVRNQKISVGLQTNKKTLAWVSKRPDSKKYQK